MPVCYSSFLIRILFTSGTKLRYEKYIIVEMSHKRFLHFTIINANLQTYITNLLRRILFARFFAKPK